MGALWGLVRLLAESCGGTLLRCSQPGAGLSLVPYGTVALFHDRLEHEIPDLVDGPGLSQHPHHLGDRGLEDQVAGEQGARLPDSHEGFVHAGVAAGQCAGCGNHHSAVMVATTNELWER